MKHLIKYEEYGTKYDNIDDIDFSTFDSYKVLRTMLKNGAPLTKELFGWYDYDSERWHVTKISYKDYGWGLLDNILSIRKEEGMLFLIDCVNDKLIPESMLLDLINKPSRKKYKKMYDLIIDNKDLGLL